MNNDISEIIPGLYISNWFASNNENIMEEYNIKLVITLETRGKPRNILNYYNKNKIHHIHYYLDDHPNADIKRFFDHSESIISEYIRNNKNVLVHCYAGISRSATIVLNYLLKDYYIYNNIYDSPEFSLNYILNFCKGKRRFVNPNIGFLRQLLLKTYEYDLNYNHYNLYDKKFDY
jgi:dual specificity phosphatase 12